MKAKYGVHCSSTAIMNYLLNNGLTLSEELVFGIGQGLGFTFFVYEDVKFPYASGRGSNIIENFFYNIGVELEKRYNVGFDIFLDEIYRNKQVIAKLDWNFLPHISNSLRLNEYYPFSEHHAVVAVHPESRDKLFLIDHLWPTIEIDCEQFKRSWFSYATKPFPICGEYYFITEKVRKSMSKISISKEIIMNAIKSNIWEFLYPYNPLNDYYGIRGLKKFFKYIQQLFNKKEEITDLLRFLYISLERIGTGGGCFRRIYARFLYECAVMFCCDILNEISFDFLRLSKEWKKFNSCLISAEEINSKKDKIIELLGMIIVEEEKLAFKLLNTISVN